jgi:protein involved in polysaccharide export with SLBB domain
MQVRFVPLACLVWLLAAFLTFNLGPAAFAAAPEDRDGALAVLRSGDIVSVVLPGEATLNKDFPIDSRGQILLPEIGLTTIAGLTAEKAGELVKRQLATAFRDLDRLRLILKERRLMIQVGGYVKSPGTFNLPGDAGVQAAITAAGGIAQGAQLDRFKVIRKGREIVFDYKKFLTTGDPKILPDLEPLDTLFVPASGVTGNVQVDFDGRTLSQAGDGGEERNSIKVFGEVNTPAVYSYKAGASIVDMLLRAGGVTRYATVESIKILSNGEPSIFNLQAYLDSGDKALLPTIAPGATIFIPKQIEEIRIGKHTVYVMGEVAKPGPYDTKPGATFIDILANAGGPTRYAETRQMRVLHADGTVANFDLVAYSEGKVKKLPDVLPGDAIFMPEKVENHEPSWLKTPPGRAIHIIGAVVKPGRYEWSNEMSFFDLLAAAGGPNPRADIAHVQVLRKEGDTAKPLIFNLEEFLAKGGSIKSVPKLAAGFVVSVPELLQNPSDTKATWTKLASEKSIYIIGAVGRPGRYAMTPAMGFLDVLTAADGPTTNADLRNVRVSHRRTGEARVSTVNLARYFSTGDDHILPKVRAGDLIFIPDRNHEWLDDPKETTVRVLGAIGKPGRYRFTDNMTILDLLAEAGGPTTAALQSRILVVNLGCCTEQARTFDLLSFAKSADTRMLPVVRSGDTIYVPDQSQSETRQTLDFVKDLIGIVSSVTSISGALSTTTTTTTTNK